MELEEELRRKRKGLSDRKRGFDSLSADVVHKTGVFRISSITMLEFLDLLLTATANPKKKRVSV